MNNDRLREFLFLFLAWFVTYFAPVAPFILIIGGFIIADIFTAITAVVKKQGWKAVSSRRLRDTLYKFIVFSIGLLVAHAFQEKFFPEFPALKLIAGYIALGELKSIDENIEKVTGKSIFGSMIKQFKKS